MTPVVKCDPADRLVRTRNRTSGTILRERVPYSDRSLIPQQSGLLRVPDDETVIVTLFVITGNPLWCHKRDTRYRYKL